VGAGGAEQGEPPRANPPAHPDRGPGRARHHGQAARRPARPAPAPHGGLYTLAICVYFGPVASLEWLLCCFSASGFEAFVQDPLKIAIVVILGDQAEYLVDLYLEFMDYMPFQL
jgi:hypothetical protein